MQNFPTDHRHLQGVLKIVVERIASAPTRFDKRFLESLELKSPSDRNIIGVLKALKFISDEGAPTERYRAFQDQTRADLESSPR